MNDEDSVCSKDGNELMEKPNCLLVQDMSIIEIKNLLMPLAYELTDLEQTIDDIQIQADYV